MMGSEEVATSHDTNVASSDSEKSTNTNDHSNPQQGTVGTKTAMQEKQDSGRQKKKNRNAVTAKSNASPQSNHVEDKRKLFVGGLPTDITVPEFQSFFSQFGELHEAVVMFDRETRCSRGFGFVTYVNSDISKSLLQMGNRGDGIGRLVMRGKTCEVKAAAPKGQAPIRGGKSNRNNRGGPRNQHQTQAHQVSSFGYNEQFPAMYQHGNSHTSYPQGMYSPIPGVLGYAPPVYHYHMPSRTHAQPHSSPHESIPLSIDRDPRNGGNAGAPYLFATHLGIPPPDQFWVPNTFPPTPQIPANYQQQDYAFVPYVPGHTQSALPVTEMTSVMQPMEPSMQPTAEMNNKDKAVIKIEKE